MNYNNNNPIEDLEGCVNCIPIDLDREYTSEEKKNQCQESCEFMKCGYKCRSNNRELHYDKEKGIYLNQK